jgi:Ca2+/H+ antiporter
MFVPLMCLMGVIPWAYLIGICVDDLSHQLGIVLGVILNSVLMAIAELIPYWFSLEEDGLADFVRATIISAFFMSLLLMPGFGMLAAGLKWSEVVLK